MTTFAVTPTTGAADQAGALNYALNNIGAGLRVNANTGIVSIPNGNPTNVYEYLYQWVQVAFADDAQGNGISFEPTNKLFYGLLNTDTLTQGTVPSPQSNYTWYSADEANISGGFGTDKSLYYYVEGIGRVLWVGGFIASPPSQALPAVQTGFDFYNYVDVTKITWSQVNSISIATVATITPQSSEPINSEVGTITVADRTNWDPVGVTTGTAYPVFYDGTTWTQLGGTTVHAMYQSTATQTIAVSTASYRMTLNVVDFSYAITQNDGLITLDGPGVYDLQWSGQFQNSNSNVANSYIWLRQNGVDVPGSAGEVTIPGKHGSTNGAIIAGWNYYIQTTTASETVELWWGAQSTDVSLSYLPPGTDPIRPGTASLIVTIAKLTT